MLATCVVPIPCLHIIFMGYHKQKKVGHKYMLCEYVSLHFFYASISSYYFSCL